MEDGGAQSITGYKTIEGRCSAQIIEKKSRFIAQLCHVGTEADALTFLQEVRDENAGARHNVYAYILKDGRTRYSDDGEPAQTSGLPTIEVLQHNGLKDVICVTTRYFGGVLLGTGGLVRAYTQAVKAAIACAHIVEIETCVDIRVDVDYSLYSPLLNGIEKTDARILSSEFKENVELIFRVKQDGSQNLCDLLTNITHGRARIDVSAPFEGAIQQIH